MLRFHASKVVSNARSCKGKKKRNSIIRHPHNHGKIEVNQKES